MKINKITKKIKVTESDFKDFSSIPTILDHFEKSMVLYIATWQEVPDDNQKDTMTTKPEWFIEFENKQEQRWKEQQEFNQKVVQFMYDQDKRWKEQQEFNQRILSLVESLVKRIDNLAVKNNLKE